MFLSQHIYSAVEQHLPGYAGNILEIGAFEGEGTRQLALRFPDRKIYTIDPFIEDGYTTAATEHQRGSDLPKQRAAFDNNTHQFANVVLFDCTSKDFMAVQTDLADLDIGCVIIDGSHHYPDVTLDSDLALRCLAHRPGLIVFDDLAIQDVNLAVQEFVDQNYERIRQIHQIYDVAVAIEIAAK